MRPPNFLRRLYQERKKKEKSWGEKLLSFWGVAWAKWGVWRPSTIFHLFGCASAHGDFQEDLITDAVDILIHSGESLTVAGAHPLVLPLPLAEVDLSAWDGLALAALNLSDEPFAVGLRLFHGGDNAPFSVTGGREPLLPGHPREIFFPWDSFGSYGRTDEFRCVVRAEAVFRRERDCVGPLELAARVAGLRAFKRAPVRGPRLSGLGLDQVLGQPLREITLRKHFLPYSSSPALLAVPPPVFPYPADSKAEVLAGWIMGHDVGLPPDWAADPEGELEWRHFLHRHHFLRVLIQDPAPSVRAATMVLLDWIDRNPAPVDSDGGAGPAWETLSTAWRLREWMHLLAAIWNDPECDEAAQRLILRSVWEHARHLRDHLGHPGNWRLIEAAALALAGLAFPEFREAREWTALGLTRLEREALTQFLPDGFHQERSPLYHGLCIEACLEVFMAARQAGTPFPEAITQRLPQSVSALAALVRPDGTWSSLNDAASADRDYRPLLRLAREALGAHPRRAGPSRLFPDAGFAVLRCKGAWALLKAGPRPLTHAHDDDLSVEVCLDGRTVLLDPGITRYAPSAWTAAARTAGAHSCLFGQAFTRRAARILAFKAPGLYGAQATRYGQGCAHTRELLVLDRGIVVVRDTISGSFGSDLRAHWQFAPGPLRVNLRTGSAEGAGFRFVPLLGGAPVWVRRREGEDQPPAGFVSLSGRDIAAPRLEFAFSPGERLCLWWVFLGPGARVRQTQSGLTIRLADGTLIRLAADPWALRSSPPRRTNGKTPA